MIYISQTKIRLYTICKIGTLLFLLKLLYVFMIIQLLPRDYMLWSFRKNVNVNYVWLEMLPFSLGLFIYLKTFRHNAYCVFITILFMMAFIPANSGLCLSNDSMLFFIQNNIYIIILMTILGIYSIKEGNISDRGNQFMDILNDPKTQRFFRIMMIISLLFKLYQIYQYNGLNLASIFISVMYDVRANYAEYFANNTGTLYTYLTIILNTFSNWFLLIYLYISIINRKKFDFIFSIFVLVAIFSTEMMKSTLFIIVVIVYAAWATRNHILNKLSEVLISSMIIFFAISLLEYYFFNSKTIFSIVIRRMFYVPNYMEYCHYEFFSVHHKLWFTQDFFFVQNILSNMIGRFYPHEAVRLISEKSFDGLVPAPNAGLFAEGYAQLGIIGIIIFPFLHAGIVKYMNNLLKPYGNGISFIIMIKLYLSMAGVYIFASFYIVPLILFGIITRWLKFVNRKHQGI